MKIKTYLYCLALAALLLPYAYASTVEVNSNLQAAIDAAAPGDTLLVAPGVYDKIEIAKSLNLIGGGATIRANERDACVKVKADRVNISGFLVRDGFYGISLENVSQCNISGNTVIRCTQPGIMLKYSQDNIIVHNNASFNGLGGEGWYGIYLTNSNDNLIEDNVASNNGAYGINLFPSCNNNSIKGNILERNMYGLYMFTDCRGNLIESNVMSRNINSGLDMRYNCHQNLILNNTISNNAVAGITLMEGSGRNTIRGNSISSNKRYGIQIQSASDGNIIIENNISDSQTGLFLDSSDNLLYGNRLADNVVQAEDRGSNTWNEDYPEGGNMWSDYLGQDNMSGPEQDQPGSDRIGDVPYRINERAQDRYPLMGNQVRAIKIVEKRIDPQSITIGSNVLIQVVLDSKYSIGQVSVHAVGAEGVGAGGYVRMIPEGQTYQGTLITALMEPGKYNVVLDAKDARGNELKESLGEIDISPRGAGI